MSGVAGWTPVAAPVLRGGRGGRPPVARPGVAAPGSPVAPPAWRAFRSRVGCHVLVLEGTQIVDVLPGASMPRGADVPPDGDVPPDVDAAALAPYLAHGATLELGAVPQVAPQSISLNLTSACNLACGYCYAGRGAFDGAQSGAMSRTTAEAAVDRLLAGCDRRARATIGFLGGEPFLRRDVLAHVVRYASERAGAQGQPIGFSVTTNGTLLEPADLDLLRGHPFAVTVSLDGDRRTHDRQRPTPAGRGSWDTALRAVRPLLVEPGLADVTARATVSADDVDLAGGHDALVAEGFATVGFAPVRVGHGAFDDATWPRWLAAAVELGERCLADILAGRRATFENLTVALRQIDAGACSPYPCGAGGGYFSVATDGAWFACHRAIGDERFALHDRDGEVDAARQRAFLDERHVERSEPCRSCWARYLCGGGCHHEAHTRTTAACDVVRTWLEFCLDAYCTVSAGRPEWFEPAIRPVEDR